MRTLTLFSFITLGASIACAAPIGATMNFNTTIFDVNLATNAEVSTSTSFFQSDSLAMDMSGNLYSADPNGIIWDVTTPGNFPVGPTGFLSIADLDWGNNGLFGFSNANQTLFHFDPINLIITWQVTDPTLAAYTMTGVAHRPSDGSTFLSGYDGTGDYLFQFAPSSSVAVTVGFMAQADAFSYISDIDFDANGTLYAMTWYHRWFYSVNTVNATTTFVSAGPHRDVTGLALNPVPEPTLLALAPLTMIALKKRRKS